MSVLAIAFAGAYKAIINAIPRPTKRKKGHLILPSKENPPRAGSVLLIMEENIALLLIAPSC